MEYNKLCNGEHPCFNGKSGNPLLKFDGSKGTKDMRIKEFNKGVMCRQSDLLSDTTLISGSIKSSDSKGVLELQYDEEVSNGTAIFVTDQINIFYEFGERVKQHCSYALRDNDLNKLLLVDPADYSTQHIFFDNWEDDAARLEVINFING